MKNHQKTVFAFSRFRPSLFPLVALSVTVASCSFQTSKTIGSSGSGVGGSLGAGQISGPGNQGSTGGALSTNQLLFTSLPPACSLLSAAVPSFGVVGLVNATGSPLPFPDGASLRLEVCDPLTVAAQGCTPLVGVANTLFATNPSAIVAGGAAQPLNGGFFTASQSQSYYVVAQLKVAGSVLQTTPVAITVSNQASCGDVSQMVLLSPSPLPAWSAGASTGSLTLLMQHEATAPTGLMIRGVASDGQTVSFGPMILPQTSVSFDAAGSTVSVTGLTTPHAPTAGIILSTLGSKFPLTTGFLPISILAGPAVRIAWNPTSVGSLADAGTIDLSHLGFFNVGMTDFFTAQMLDQWGNYVNVPASMTSKVKATLHLGSGCTGAPAPDVTMATHADIQVRPNQPGLLGNWPYFTSFTFAWSHPQPLYGAMSLQVSSPDLSGPQGSDCHDFYSTSAIVKFVVSGQPFFDLIMLNGAVVIPKIVINSSPEGAQGVIQQPSPPETSTLTIHAYRSGGGFCAKSQLLTDFFVPGTATSTDVTFGRGATNTATFPPLAINPSYLSNRQGLPVLIGITSSNPHLASSHDSFLALSGDYWLSCPSVNPSLP